MNHFDPFYSTEYKKQSDATELGLEMQPCLIKKSDSEFISNVLDFCCQPNDKAQEESEKR